MWYVKEIRVGDRIGCMGYAHTAYEENTGFAVVVDGEAARVGVVPFLRSGLYETREEAEAELRRLLKEIS